MTSSSSVLCRGISTFSSNTIKNSIWESCANFDLQRNTSIQANDVFRSFFQIFVGLIYPHTVINRYMIWLGTFRKTGGFWWRYMYIHDIPYQTTHLGREDIQYLNRDLIVMIMVPYVINLILNMVATTMTIRHPPPHLHQPPHPHHAPDRPRPRQNCHQCKLFYNHCHHHDLSK